MNRESHPRFSQFLQALMSLDYSSQMRWFEAYLQSQPCEPEPPLSKLDKDEFIIRIHDESDIDQFRNNLKAVLSELFECCEGIEDKKEYFFSLLSLITYFRPYLAKQRLRRLLYSGVVEGLRFDVFDLESELIVANCQYDVDTQLKNFIMHTLANGNDFKEYALACYRGLMYAYDDSPFFLIPKMARFWSDNDFFLKFAYHLEVSIDKSGIDTFAKTYLVILGAIRKMDSQLGEKFNKLLAESIFPTSPRIFVEPYYFVMYLRIRIERGELINVKEIAKFASDSLDLEPAIKRNLLAKYVRRRKEINSTRMIKLTREKMTIEGYSVIRPGPGVTRWKKLILVSEEGESIPLEPSEEKILTDALIEEQANVSILREAKRDG